MIYPYRCQCGNRFEVTKRVGEIEADELCKCGKLAERIISSRQTFYNEKVEDAQFCPAMGCVVKNSAHRRKLAKERGLIEVGNEDMCKWYDKVVKDKEIENKKYYEDVCSTKIEIKSRGR